MRRFLIYLLLFIAAVWIGVKIQADPGYVLIAYGSWLIETPLWFAALIILLCFLILYTTLRLFKNLQHFGERVRNHAKFRRWRKSQWRTQQGLKEFTEGNWQAAEHNLLAAIEHNDASLINYLTAAKAAQEQGAYQRRDDYLRKAHQYTPDADIAIGLTQAQLQLAQGQWEQSLASLRHLHSVAPQHPVVLRLLKTVYVNLQDWSALAALLPLLRKQKVYSTEVLTALEIEINHALLNIAIKQQSLADVQTLWQSFSKSARQDPQLLTSYGYFLLQQDQATAAQLEPLLRDALNKYWHETLVNLYGLIKGDNSKKQLATAEQWQKQHPTAAAIYLCLARLCLQQELIGNAQDYLEQSIKLQPTAAAYQELGLLYQQQGATDKALQAFAAGLNLVQK